MRPRPLAPLLLLAGLLGPSLAAADVWWRERSDQPRHEGLLPDQPISGKTFELIGVQLVSTGAPGPVADELTLRVPRLADAPALEVAVRERPSNYLMKPARPLAPGGASFSWRASEVVGPAKLLRERLSVLAAVPGGETYYPAFIGAPRREPTAPVYEFRFFSRAEWAATGVVRVETENGLAKVRSLGASSGPEGLAAIRWDGKADDGSAAPSGVHVLELAGEMYLNPVEELRRSVRFHHYGPAVAW